MSEPPEDERQPSGGHLRRITTICLVLSAVSIPVAFFVVGPHLPPGDASFQGENQVWVNRVLAAIVAPVFLSVIAAIVYSVVAFRDRSGSGPDAPPRADSDRARRWWVGSTAAVVVFLFAFGTYEWVWAGVGSGGGQGPVPLVKPDEPTIEVQVIAQQWAFTYRYPQFGGVETPHLVLPAGTYAELHVTSLDVIHSFWAVELAAKADAVPGFDNVIYVKPLETGSFRIKCVELCGLWHGQMYDTGDVVSPEHFAQWGAQQEQQYASITKDLPPYAPTYDPEPRGFAG